MLGRADRGLTQSGEKLTSSGAGLPAPMRHLGSPGPARILEGAKVLVCKPIMHCKGDATTIGPATNTVVTEEDRLVRFMAAVADDDRHDLALATFRVGFEPDTTQLREQIEQVRMAVGCTSTALGTMIMTTVSSTQVESTQS